MWSSTLSLTARSIKRKALSPHKVFHAENGFHAFLPRRHLLDKPSVHTLTQTSLHQIVAVLKDISDYIGGVPA